MKKIPSDSIYMRGLSWGEPSYKVNIFIKGLFSILPPRGNNQRPLASLIECNAMLFSVVAIQIYSGLQGSGMPGRACR